MLPALAGSAIFHAFVLGLIAFQFAGPEIRLPETGPPVMELDLISNQPALPDSTESTETPEPPVLPEPIEPLPEQPPQPRVEPVSEMDTPPPESIPESLAEQSREEPEARDLPDHGSLREQARSLARELPVGPDPEDLPGIRRSRQADLPGTGPVARLPSPPTWLSRRTGPVEPSSQTMREGIGAVRGRVVRADGQVFCSYTELQGMFEQFAVAVTTWFPCGRERPEEPDTTDPWVRPFGQN